MVATGTPAPPGVVAIDSIAPRTGLVDGGAQNKDDTRIPKEDGYIRRAWKRRRSSWSGSAPDVPVTLSPPPVSVIVSLPPDRLSAGLDVPGTTIDARPTRPKLARMPSPRALRPVLRPLC